MQMMPPFELRAWIDRHRHLLEPPVGNKLLFEQGEFIVMAVGGPNARRDFHHDPGPELFFQVEGDMVLRIIESDVISEVPIKEGEIFLLPPEVPHSPQRPAASVGIVVERRRGPQELDGFSWYCETCGNRLHLERLAISDIVRQLPPLFARFFASRELRTCARCGSVLPAPPSDGAERG